MNFGISQSSNSLSAILSFVGLMAICLLLSCSCEKSPPTEPPPEPAEPPPQAELTLELVDVGMSEAWLRFGVSKVELPQAFTISRDGGEVFTDSLYTADTLLYDSSLAFNSTYTYRAYRIVDGIKTDSTSLQASTLGATSHNFQWELIEIPSPYGSGVLRDVAIINENDIWAVGKIFADSTQTWLPYNAVHWNGQQWELKRIRTNACGGVVYPPIETIFAFSANDILFAHIDGSITHFDGNNFTNDCSLITQLNGSAKKMWGRSKDDLYVVSGNGFIAHYNGSSWQKIESGTQTTMQDIWGAQDPQTGEWEILCAASPGYGVADTGIYRITANHEVQPVPWVSGRAARSVWFDKPSTVYACGSGIFRKVRSGPWEEIGGVGVIPAQTERLRGVAPNDIFVVGHFGHIAHFNGIDFRVVNPNPAILYESCDYSENLMVAVGYDGNSAFILRVQR